jgi:hypothetical protein
VRSGRNVGKSGGFKYGERGCGCKAAGKSDQISDSQISGQPDLADFTRAQEKLLALAGGGPRRNNTHSALTHLLGQCFGCHFFFTLSQGTIFDWPDLKAK